jgi:large subunit ribosomal protein L23
MKHPRQMIRRIQVTEKAAIRGEQSNQYFFEVAPAVNKLEIRQAIEALYGVKVAAVNTMRYAGKMRRMRTARYTQRPDWKRAVVTLKPGSKIDLT